MTIKYFIIFLLYIVCIESKCQIIIKNKINSDIHAFDCGYEYDKKLNNKNITCPINNVIYVTNINELSNISVSNKSLIIIEKNEILKKYNPVSEIINELIEIDIYGVILYDKDKNENMDLGNLLTVLYKPNTKDLFNDIFEGFWEIDNNILNFIESNITYEVLYLNYELGDYQYKLLYNKSSVNLEIFLSILWFILFILVVLQICYECTQKNKLIISKPPLQIYLITAISCLYQGIHRLLDPYELNANICIITRCLISFFSNFQMLAYVILMFTFINIVEKINNNKFKNLKLIILYFLIFAIPISSIFRIFIYYGLNFLDTIASILITLSILLTSIFFFVFGIKVYIRLNETDRALNSSDTVGERPKIRILILIISSTIIYFLLLIISIIIFSIPYLTTTYRGRLISTSLSNITLWLFSLCIFSSLAYTYHIKIRSINSSQSSNQDVNLRNNRIIN